nr:MAG TPA: hypothetical protein [Caudoviricetes sp.]
MISAFGKCIMNSFECFEKLLFVGRLGHVITPFP